MKSDYNGCSTCPLGAEQFEGFENFQGEFRVQYDYRHTNGRLFTTVAPDLETARARRDDWVEQFIAKVVAVLIVLLVASAAHAADRRPLTALIAASVADAVTTERAISRVPSAYEANPFLSGSAFRREATKAACTAGLVWGLARVRRQHPTLAAVLAWTATGSLAIVAAHNAAIGGR